MFILLHVTLLAKTLDTLIYTNGFALFLDVTIDDQKEIVLGLRYPSLNLFPHMKPAVSDK